jgi:hypothetical protein
MYQFSENFNDKALFWFKKSLIKNLNWAMLPTAAKAIFPVIACHCNESGKAFPGQLRLAILSGLSVKQVIKGIRGLKGFPDIKIKRSIPNEYYLKLPKEHIRGETFPFFQLVLEYGLWRELLPAAKSLYPVMRCFSSFDMDIYLDILEDGENDPTDFDEVFEARQFDMCNMQKIELAHYAGIHRNSINCALKSLETNCLIDWNDEWELWQVYLKSKDNSYWKREYLNKKILDSFRHTLD